MPLTAVLSSWKVYTSQSWIVDMNRCFLLALTILLSMAASASADEIKFSKVTFSNGQTMVARVICYENDEIIIRNLAGEEITEPMERVESIRFDEGENALPEPGELDKLLLAEAERVRRESLEGLLKSDRYKESPELQERLEKDPPAVVAMYLDTEDPGDQLKQVNVKYRWAGSSGSRPIRLRRPWATLELIVPRKTGERRIELDPGPPFKTKSIPVELTPGEVFNLGRVVLEKDEAVATA